MPPVKEQILPAEALQAAIFNSVNFSSIATDAEGVIQIFNVGAERLLGYAASEVVNKITPAELSDPDELISRAEALSLEFDTVITPGFEALVYRAARGIEDIYELTRIRKNGTRYQAMVSVTALRDPDKKIIGYLLIGTDNTLRHQAEAELAKIQARFRAFFDIDIIGMAITSPDKGMLSANNQICRILGYERDELLAMKWSEITHLDDLPADEAYFAQLMRNEIDSYSLEKRFIRKNGTPVSTNISVKCVRLPDGTVDYLLSLVEDITTRKRAEKTLRASEINYRRLFEAAKDGILILDADTGKIEDVNPYLAELLGYQHSDFIGKQLWEIGAFRDILANKTNLAELQRKRYIRYENLPLVTKTDTLIYVEFVSNSYEVNGRSIIQCNIRDITERKIAADAVKESETRFRQLAENISQVFYLFDPEMTQMLYVSAAYEKIWDRSCESLYANPRSWGDSIHPDDIARVMSIVAPQGTIVPSDTEYRILRPDGSERSIRARTFPIRDARGQVYRYAGLAEDVTAQKNTERQLLQGQKMEAVGRLSGGIAHDFNNLLTVILGHASILELSELSANVKDSLSEIRKAAERAAKLTRQLLLFARQEKMQLQYIDVDSSIAQTIKMLKRILGEDIDLDFRPSPTPLHVRADPGMLDQVLMNLAVNARDAMPQGGRLIIETAMKEFDAESASRSPLMRVGAFAVISVSDSGFGISAEILPRIFDPFFTTKEVGKGTGLGLATAFGIVQQHNGWMMVYSEVGYGTTFRVYLPLDKPAGELQKANEEPHTLIGGHETILVVEDETGIQNLVIKYLTRLGYEVLTAGTAAEALKVFAGRRQDIALLLTDMVMPGGSTGAELGRHLLRENPGLKIIYSSGYSDIRISDSLVLTEGINFLAKPFSLPALGEIIRNKLDARQV